MKICFVLGWTLLYSFGTVDVDCDIPDTGDFFLLDERLYKVVRKVFDYPAGEIRLALVEEK